MNISKGVRSAILFAWGGKCFYCGRPGGEIDHIVPKSKGGSDEVTNLIASCYSCNTAKSDLWLPEAVLDETLKAASQLASFITEAASIFEEALGQAKDRINYGSLKLRNGTPGQATIYRAKREVLPAREVGKNSRAIVEKYRRKTLHSLHP